MNDIDFVITWVDGSDPAWLKERAGYMGLATDTGANAARFRDWGLLPFWFRSVEKFAPWVRKIHFVTWGHIPKWLNTDHPILHIVRHEDFIPACYLPTFNSHTIELNLHRIEGLSDQFVYFNDDMFLLKPARPDYFFHKGLPRDAFQLNMIYFARNGIGWINGSNTAVINDHYEMRDVAKKQFRKMFSPKNGFKRNLKNLLIILLVAWFPGIDYWHITTSFLKSSFNSVWQLEPGILDETCRCRFREKTNVSPFLIKDWQLVNGLFCPFSPRTGHCFHMNRERVQETVDAIINQKYQIICVNDTENDFDFEDAKDKIQTAFRSILPERSAFELTELL